MRSPGLTYLPGPGLCVCVYTHLVAPGSLRYEDMRRESKKSSRDSGCLFCGFLGPPEANDFGCQPVCPGGVVGWWVV